MKLSKGFTLLEVLVAMSIFSVIGLGANQMLRTIINTHEHTQQNMEEIASLTKALTVLQRDFSQVTNRPIKDGYGEPLPPFIVNNSASGDNEHLIEFSRSGWNNPLGLKRSEVQRVAYDVTEDGELKRYYWLVLDRAEDSRVIEQTLLKDIEEIRINLLNAEGDSSDSWPLDNPSALPRSAELFIVSLSAGEIRQVYSFVEEAKAVQQAGNNAVGNGDRDNAEALDE